MKPHRFIYLLAGALLCTVLASCGGNSSTQSVPTEVSMTPADGAVNVSTRPTIQISFSQPVLNVNSATVTLHKGSADGGLVGITPITQGEGNSYTFSPDTDLQDQTTYFVVVSSGVTDQSQNPVPAMTFSFTSADFSTPEVSMITPSDGATGVSATPTVQLLFSKPVQQVTVTLHERNIHGALIDITPLTAGVGNSYTFNPLAPLQLQTAYFVVVQMSETSEFHRRVTVCTFSFTTGDFSAPTMNVITPANGANNVNTSACPGF